MLLVCLALHGDECTIEANKPVNISYVDACFRKIPSNAA